MSSVALRTFKFRVKDRSSGKKLDDASRAVNLVWNHCNAMQRHALKHNQKWPNKAQFQLSTKGCAKELGVPAQSIQEVCDEYFDRRSCARRPKLRWRGVRSLGWVPFKNQTIVLSGGVIRFNGHQIRLWKHRDIGGRIKSGSFSQDARGRWYCNLVCEIEVKPNNRDAAVGIDLGLKSLAVLSTGEIINHPRVYRTLEGQLSTAQRANKRRRVAAIHARIANTRKDFLHKASTTIADRFGLIVVGNVSANWQMVTNGKSAADASWASFRNMLRYKAIARGATYVDGSEYLTTQTCSDCGSIGGPKGTEGLGIREWTCDCGAEHDRDVNAARNILRLGRQALAEGALSSAKQREASSFRRGDVTAAKGNKMNSEPSLPGSSS